MSRLGLLHAAGALVALMLVSACSTTVTGTPVAEGAGEGKTDEQQQFEALLEECLTVPENLIATTVGGDAIDSRFFGAICRWEVGGPSGATDVTFNWFETGTVQTEREVAEKLGYEIDRVTVNGRSAFLAKPPDDPGSCGITTSAVNSGVIGWWVQYRNMSGDPCAAATKLAELTLKTSY